MIKFSIIILSILSLAIVGGMYFVLNSAKNINNQESFLVGDTITSLPVLYLSGTSMLPRNSSWELGKIGNLIVHGHFNELTASSTRFATSTITDLTVTTITATAVTTTDLYVSGLLTIGPVAAGNIDGRNYNITDFNLIQANYFQATSTSATNYFLGNTGIGTTTPRYKLDVWGDLAIGTSTDTNIPTLYIDSGEGGRVGIGTTTLAGLLTVGTTTPYLVVTPNGYIGIGTANPSQVLDVAGNIRLRATTGNNELIFIGTGSTYNVISSDESLYFADTIGNYGSYTTPGAGTWGLDKIYDYGATVANAVSIQDDGGLTYFGGNVGIGTTAITHPLTIYGSEMTITATGVATTTISSATSTFAGGLIVDTNSLYVIADTGYVGIGTTTPVATLAVEGQVKATGYRLSNLYLKDDSGELEIRNVADNAYNGIQAVYLKSNSYLTVLGEIQTNTYYDLTIHANDEVDDATERNVILQVLDGTNDAWKTMLTLDPNGASPTVEFGAFNVGIGDTSPDFGLEIGASSTDGYFAVSGGSDGSGNGDKFLIDENGRVGIGTTTPPSLVTIYNLNATATAYIASGAAGLGGEIILKDNDGAGCTNITANDGVLFSTIVTCP